MLKGVKSVGDLVLIALGIVAMIAAGQLVGVCLGQDPMQGCQWSVTLILDLLGIALIVPGTVWLLARRWPSGIARQPLVRFLLTWGLIVVVGTIWMMGASTNWTFASPVCDGDQCFTGLSIGQGIEFFAPVGFVIAVVVTALTARRQPVR